MNSNVYAALVNKNAAENTQIKNIISNYYNDSRFLTAVDLSK